MQRLTDIAIRSANPMERPYKLVYGDGLFLLVNPNGSRLWCFEYRVEGREKLLSVGTYPEVALNDAADAE
jgi:Arm DNA-binding domain